MAFPGTYNIKYYKGDTFEFKVYPKDASGNTFPLEQFTSVKFTIATSRGDLPAGAQQPINGFAEIAEDKSHILCAITPDNALDLSLGTNIGYVYDVEIARTGSVYPYVYTLLTGDITITDQITPPQDLTPTLSAPGPITGLTITLFDHDSISASWTAPTTGGAPASYAMYILEVLPEYLLNPPLFPELQEASDATLEAEPFDTSLTTSYTFEGLSAETAYIIAVVAVNAAGDSTAVTSFDLLSPPFYGAVTTAVAPEEES
jgi:hypothetical protein